jgi:hypothetical protein
MHDRKVDSVRLKDYDKRQVLFSGELK